MPGGTRDGGTFHLLLISTLTGTRQTRLQAGSLFADRAPRPDAMASRSNGFRPVGERLGRTQAAVTLRQSRSRRTTPCTATSGHEQPRAATSDHERKTGAQSPRSESPSIPCGHRRSQAGAASRGAGEKVGLKTPISPPSTTPPLYPSHGPTGAPPPQNPPILGVLRRSLPSVSRLFGR